MTAQVSRHGPERTDDTYANKMREYVAGNVSRLEQYSRSFQRLFDQTDLYLRTRLDLDPSGGKIES